VLVHGLPWLPLPSQMPTHGLEGDPAHGGPASEPLRQIGHGCWEFDVRTAFDVSATLRDMSPVDGSSVPLDGAEKTFWTHVESPPFGIGRGAPKLQPVAVQSKSGPMKLAAERLHVPPVQSAT
jgi:hypothetical protein